MTPSRPADPPPGGALSPWVAAFLVLLLLYSSLIPFNVDWDAWSWESVRQSTVWVPFADGEPNALGLRFPLGNALVNVGAGFPLGWFAFLAFHRVMPGPAAWLAATLLAALTGAGMEVLQVVIPGRSISMTDVATVGIGGGLGGLASWCVAELLWRRFVADALPRIAATPGVFPLLLWLAFLALRSFFPDNVVTSAGDLREAVKRVNVIPGEVPHRHLFAQLRGLGLPVGGPEAENVPFSVGLTGTQYALGLLGNLLLYGLIGASRQQVRGGGPLGVLATGLDVTLLAFAVELGQLLFPSQVVDVNAVMAGAAGGCLGAGVWVLLRGRRGALRWLCFAAVVAYIATQQLRPGAAREAGADAWQIDATAFVPLYYYWQSAFTLAIFKDMLEGIGLFLPLGWLLGTWGRERWPRGAGPYALAAGFTLLLALGIEVLQSAIARTPSIDDVVWGVLGGILGCRLQDWFRAATARDREAAVAWAPRPPVIYG
jgi:VanZ family protein